MIIRALAELAQEVTQLRAQLAQVEQERDQLRANRGIGDSDIQALLIERDALKARAMKAEAMYMKLRACPEICHGCSSRVAALESRNAELVGVLREVHHALREASTWHDDLWSTIAQRVATALATGDGEEKS